MQKRRYCPPAGWGGDALCLPVLLQEGLKPLGGWPPPAAPEGRTGLYGLPPTPLSIWEGVACMGLIPHWQHYVQSRGASLLPGAVVEVIPSGPMGGRGGQAEGRVRLSLGARWQQDYLGACFSAGALYVLGAPGNHRTAAHRLSPARRWACRQASTSASFAREEEVVNRE